MLRLTPYILVFAAFLPAAAQCQDSEPPIPTCKDLRTGTYYSYPKNSSDGYSCIRKGRNEIEKNLSTGDSTIWEVTWTDKCSYTMRYVRGSEQLQGKMEKFLENHQLVFRVGTITDEYYIYSEYVDEISKKPYAIDTIWFREKEGVAIRADHYRFISGESWLKKRHFSDTSQYAVLYLYRPGKTTNSLAGVPIYLNDTAVWVAKNKSACILLLKSEGPIELKSKLYKDSSSVRLDIKFGQRYYVKSMIHWGLYKRLYNFKLEMAAMKPEDAKGEFEEIAAK